MQSPTGSLACFDPSGGKLYNKVLVVKDKSRRKKIGAIIVHDAVKSGRNN